MQLLCWLHLFVFGLLLEATIPI
uniref:Uncharacterized protein n=1 Tax=Acrobeloides nanus TaxID=290746 RepID=A0A914DHT9_9BILA